MSTKKYKYIFITIILSILIFLNINKYREMNDVVIPVWSSYDEEYYNQQNNSFIDKLQTTFSPERLIYGITRVRLQAPITYLKREIPLLAYYTPEELKEPTETIYRPENNPNSIIRLKFNIQDEKDKSSLAENSKDTINNNQQQEEIIDLPEKRVIRPQNRPTIAIYHTHTSETYMDDPRNQDSNGHVLPGNIGNIGKVGMELARILSGKYGFRVIHTTKVHDESYARSYYNSRNTLKELLNSNREVDLVLDLHRDGIKTNVSREAITTIINNQRTANVMIVIGNGKYNYGDQKNQSQSSSSWNDNLHLANSMSTLMDQMYPGLLRRVEVRDTTSNRYNQDLHPQSLLLEIGDYRNTTQEAIGAVRYVADVIGAMY